MLYARRPGTSPPRWARARAAGELAARAWAAERARGWWWCEIHRAEGQYLAGDSGPLAGLPGAAAWGAGVLVLDGAAYALLAGMGDASDWRITGGAVPVLHAAGGAYPLRRVEDESPMPCVTGATGG